MINLATTAFDPFAKSATTLIDTVQVIGNVAICTDSLCTTGRAGINFYCSPNPVAKVFFGASCVWGLMGAAASGTALVTSFVGIPPAGLVS